jgi:PEP-CTERM motif-containing protein
MKNFLSRLSGLQVVIAVLLLAGLSSSAFADTVLLQLPQFDTAFSGLGGYDTSEPGHHEGGGCDFHTTFCSSATADLDYPHGTIGRVSVSTTSPFSGAINGPLVGAGASVTSYFEVTGPFFAMVPLVIHGFVAVTTSGPGGSLGTGGIDIRIPVEHLQVYSNSYCDSTNARELPVIGVNCDFEPATSTAIVALFQVPTGLPALAKIEVGCETLSGTCINRIDPTIDFAPGFDPTGFTLVFSPSPTSSSPVPEPSTLGLLSVGFLGLGGIAVVRRPLRSKLRYHRLRRCLCVAALRMTRR